MTVERAFLIGLSGAGKTTVGALLADRMGWRFIDSDAEIERRAGKSVEALFRDDGETAFREIEADVLEDLAVQTAIVVGTGGGAPTNRRSAHAIASGLVIWLDVTPERAAKRLAENSSGAVRPLLAGDPVARLQSMAAARRTAYERSDHALAVDYYSPERVAERIAELIRAAGPEWRDDRERFGQLPAASGRRVAAVVSTPTGGSEYPIVVQRGAVNDVGPIAKGLDLRGRAFVLSDSGVAAMYGAPVAASLGRAGYAVLEHSVAGGEQHKTLDTVATIYDWLLRARVERSDFLVCVGGGVVTDMGGFAAATVLRGIDFIHVPTTMLGMVDASVGGKTGVDHPMGKNLIGAFAQPRAVLIDPAVLLSLPERETRAGCAELIKHGFILDAGLLADLEATGGSLAELCSEGLIGRSVAIKAEIVSGDEREGGQRSLLNYGHTVGHAVESVTGFAGYLHGEAVAIGMRAAGRIAVELGMLAPGDFDRQQRLIRACGLPERAEGVDVDRVMSAMLSDKKVRDGQLRWVLLEGMGQAVVRSGVPPEVVRKAVAEVCE